MHNLLLFKVLQLLAKEEDVSYSPQTSPQKKVLIATKSGGFRTPLRRIPGWEPITLGYFCIVEGEISYISF